MLFKTALKAVLRKLGYGIYAIPKSGNIALKGFHYAEASPNATLAPWLGDAEFLDVFERAKRNTLVDVYRMYELWNLVAETAKVGGDIVEVGVWRGGSGCLMAAREQRLGGSGTVWLCDTFTGVVKAGAGDSNYRGGEHNDTSVAIVENLANDLNVTNKHILVGIFPDESGKLLDAKVVRLLHIDVDVYSSAKDCVNFLWDRMPPGAMIVFDDYGFVGCEGVTRCVDEFRARNDMFYLHNLNGHAVLIKR
ncbi:MAG: class I SAM-dependent methyltransferase [Phyllobacteriaceae bacterium]|nr:class I SAM-dependent methyltransferase [Phyllobacteriaceae bacterium]